MKLYRKGTRLDQKKYNFVLHAGGVGDLIACLPAIKFSLDHNINLFIYLWVQDYAIEFVSKMFEKYPNVKVRPISAYQKEVNENLPTRSPYVHKVSNVAMNFVDHSFMTLAHTSVENKYKNYIQLDPIDVSSFNLPEKYIVVTTGYTSDTREWKASSVNAVSDYIISKGYTPVYLGKGVTVSSHVTTIVGTFNADYTKGINLIDKTNLFEAHAIMANAKCVLGLDNGLLHLAGMSKVPIIAGFTTVLPEHRLPYRDDVLGKDCLVVIPTEQELACIGCQSKMTFADTGHTFTKCWYGPLDYKCLDLMTSDKWIEKLKELGI